MITTPTVTTNLLARFWGGAQGGYTDTQRVATLADETGNGNSGTANTRGAVFRASGLGGRGALYFDGGGTGYQIAANRMDVSLTGYTFAWALSFPDGVNASTALFAKDTSGGFARMRYWMSANGCPDRILQFESKVMRVCGCTVVSYTFRPDSGNPNSGTEMWHLEGRLIATRTGSMPAYDTTSPWRIGSYDPAAGELAGYELGELRVYGALSDGEITAVHGQMMNDWIGEEPLNIVWDSNSLDTNLLPSNPPVLVAKAIRNSILYCGYGFKRISQQRAMLNAGIYGAPKVGKINLLIAGEGTNAYNSNEAAAFQSDFISYATAGKALGYDPVMITTGPAAFITDAGKESLRLADNAAFRALDATEGRPWKALLDWGSDPIMGQTGQNLNTTYYDGDGTHYTQVGKNHRAAFLLGGVGGVLARTKERTVTSSDVAAIAAAVREDLPLPDTKEEIAQQLERTNGPLYKTFLSNAGGGGLNDAKTYFNLYAPDGTTVIARYPVLSSEGGLYVFGALEVVP